MDYYYWIQPFTIGFGVGSPSSPAARGLAGLPASWAGFPFLPGTNWVDTGSFLGPVFVSEPYIWNAHLRSWLFLPADHVSESGAWTYIFR
jgi:hypothetical protein